MRKGESVKLEKMNEIRDNIYYLQVECQECDGRGYFEKGFRDPTPFEKNYLNINEKMLIKVMCDCNFYEGDRNSITYEDIEGYVNEQERKIREYISRNIPELYQNADNVNPKLNDFIFKMTENICWLSGGTGTGKTYSLYAQYKNNYKWGGNLFYIKSEYDFSFKNLENVLEFDDITVCIDDIGMSENDTRIKSLHENYFKLIDDAILKNKKIVFTSNYTFKNYCKKVQSDLSQRMLSRFEGYGVEFNFGMEDLRVKK